MKVVIGSEILGFNISTEMLIELIKIKSKCVSVDENCYKEEKW